MRTGAGAGSGGAGGMAGAGAGASAGTASAVGSDGAGAASAGGSDGSAACASSSRSRAGASIVGSETPSSRSRAGPSVVGSETPSLRAERSNPGPRDRHLSRGSGLLRRCAPRNDGEGSARDCSALSTLDAGAVSSAGSASAMTPLVPVVSPVMTGLVPVIHDLLSSATSAKSWMAGTRHVLGLACGQSRGPAMTGWGTGAGVGTGAGTGMASLSGWTCGGADARRAESRAISASRRRARLRWDMRCSVRVCARTSLASASRRSTMNQRSVAGGYSRFRSRQRFQPSMTQITGGGPGSGVRAARWRRRVSAQARRSANRRMDARVARRCRRTSACQSPSLARL